MGVPPLLKLTKKLPLLNLIRFLDPKPIFVILGLPSLMMVFLAIDMGKNFGLEINIAPGQTEL